ncbi:hypothetical protein CEP52_010361 [Fusarium oligoseptatum]|uniref:Uncharacterized protein n=1 Tax=Fusarium oligoseptatum TaxID=2604345 RepID=A0A428T8I8_9HYPO|nr:hypothetical protein CEP52_010361 [Fusarium oligoseptatum]
MTITIAQDAELMTNIIAANPVPASRRFFAFTDEQKHPAILSQSEDLKLLLTIHIDGKPQQKNLGEIWGLSGDVQSCHLVQASDLKVFITVATDAGDSNSHFYLIQGVMPSELLISDSDKITEATGLFPTVHGIYTSNFTVSVGSGKLPMIFVALQPWDRITKEDQLAYIDATLDKNGHLKLALNKSWKLATNPLKILYVEFGTCRLGDGAFVLYETTNGLKLQFRTFGRRTFTTERTAPSGATCLASYIDPVSNASVLLVGGDKITQYGYDDYKESSGTGTTMSVSPPSGLNDMHTVQEGDSLTLWFTTSSNAAYYYSTSAKSLDQGTLIPLLPEGQGGQLSSMIHTSTDGSTLVKSLVSVNETGNLTMLQQASDTGMWTTHPIYVTADGDNIEVDSFAIRIRAVSSQPTSENEYTAACSLHLSASGYARVLRNGRADALHQDGEWFSTDHTGTITLMVPAADISCHTITIDKFKAPNDHVISLNTPLLNPSSKLAAKLSDIKTADDLLNAKTQSGKHLIAPGSLSKDDANKVAPMIHSLSELHKTLESQGGISEETDKSSSSETSPWDIFQFIFEKVKDVVEWIVEKVGDVWHFVCEWAGKTYRFLLDKVVSVGKALSWLFAKIGVGVKAIMDFAGFLFDMDYLDDLDKTVHSVASSLKDALKARKKPDAASITTNTTKDSGSEIQDGVGYTWTSYQLHHGGFVENLSSHGSSTDVRKSVKDDDPLKLAYDDLLKEVKTITKLAEETGQAFTKLYQAQCDSSEFLDTIKDAAVDAICDTIGNLVSALVQAARFIIKTFNEMGNYVIDIPIPCFKALWKKISGGRDLTLFNFIALLTAIPASVIHKLTVNCRKEAPKLNGKVNSEVFRKYVQNDPSIDKQVSEDLTIVAKAAVIAVGTLSFDVAVIMYAMTSVVDLPNGCDISPWFGNIIDCVMLNFSALGLYFSWPKKSGIDGTLRWTIWSLQLSNVVFTTFTRIFGFVTKVPRYETKRLVGVWEMITGVAIYALQMTMAADEHNLPEGDAEKDDDMTTLHQVEDTFELVGCAGFMAAALADHIQPQVTRQQQIHRVL